MALARERPHTALERVCEVAPEIPELERRERTIWDGLDPLKRGRIAPVFGPDPDRWSAADDLHPVGERVED